MLDLQQQPATLRWFDDATLGETVDRYFAEHPEIGERTKRSYRECIVHGFARQFDQPVSLLTKEAILLINRLRLQRLTGDDPINTPPRGFWVWQQDLRTLRAILRWHAAHTSQNDPWPDKRVLRLKTPEARELPLELQTIEGRRALIQELSSMRTHTANACRFIAYTGFRRREGTALRQENFLNNFSLEMQSKSRTLRVPLSSQALALIHPSGPGRLLRVTEFQLRKPLLRIFGERLTPQGTRSCVTPHDLRRYFKTVGTELGIDPTILNLLVGHSLRGVNKHYIANLRLSVLRAATQRISDEIDNPQELPVNSTLPTLVTIA